MPPKTFSIQKSQIGGEKWIFCAEFHMLDLVLFLPGTFANAFVGVCRTFCCLNWNTYSPLDPGVLSAWKFARYWDTTTNHMWGKLSCALPKPWCVDLRAWTWHRPPGYQARKHACSISKPTPDTLSDFGLLKKTSDLKTFCGTLLYAAPEIHNICPGTFYTNACDIWLLGVVVFRYTYLSFPELHQNKAGLLWCQKIVNQLQDWHSDELVDFLSTAMLIIKPESRLSARTFWEEALTLSHCITSKQTSYGTGYLVKRALTPTYTPCANTVESDQRVS